MHVVLRHADLRGRVDPLDRSVRRHVAADETCGRSPQLEQVATPGRDLVLEVRPREPDARLVDHRVEARAIADRPYHALREAPEASRPISVRIVPGTGGVKPRRMREVEQGDERL